MFREEELPNLTMFHKPHSMSSLSTPTRINRGMIVPGIDTKNPVDNAAAILSYGGLHTPPQSAHESRRPSLPYSSVSEEPVSAVYSQPATPIHGIHQGSDVFTQRWPHIINTHTTTIEPDLTTACSASAIVEQQLQAAFEPGTCNSSLAEAATMYPHVSSVSHFDNLTMRLSYSSPTDEAWRPSHGLPNNYVAHGACLGPSLFPPSHVMAPANSSTSSFDHMESSLHDFNHSYSVASMAPVQAYSAPSALYHAPQVIIPSQLSPQEDYSEQQSSDYTTPTRSYDGFQHSFSSSSTSLNEYDMIGPPSPHDVYFAHSEDDEDCLMVKAESLDSVLDRSASRSLGHLPIQPKRRASRLRKSGNRTPWCVHEGYGCTVQCAGKHCVLQGLEWKTVPSEKPHRCTYVDGAGIACKSGFDRSEHLKRHEGKHSNERRYPCPLPGCGKRIGRPDNAGDHFKTHLRPKKTGKRNAHFPWSEVHDAIWEHYEDKKIATKLLDGLRRWISNGMPDASANRRTNPTR